MTSHYLPQWWLIWLTHILQPRWVHSLDLIENTFTCISICGKIMWKFLEDFRKILSWVIWSICIQIGDDGLMPNELSSKAMMTLFMSANYSGQRFLWIVTSNIENISCRRGQQLAMHTCMAWTLTRYAKLRVTHVPGMLGTFSPPPTSKETAS